MRSEVPVIYPSLVERINLHYMFGGVLQTKPEYDGSTGRRGRVRYRV